MKKVSDSEYPAVSIVSVHISDFACRERLNYLTNCIKSLERSTYRDFEIIVVFDQSTIKDAGHVSHNFPHVKVMVCEEKIGVTESRNLGAKFGRGDYLIFLDEDTKAEPTWLEKLMNAVQCAPPEAGIFGSFEVPYDEEVGYDGVKGTCDILGGVWDERNIKREIHPKYSHFETLGFALLIKREVFEKIGGYDERFGLFGPELDLCWRARLAGYDVVYVRSAVVHHHVGITKNYYQPRKVYLLERNTLMTLIKNYSQKTLILVLPLAVAQLISEIMFFVLVGRPDLGSAGAKAILWNLRHIKENWVWHLRTQQFRRVPDKKIMNKMLKKNTRAFRLLKYLKQVTAKN